MFWVYCLDRVFKTLIEQLSSSDRSVKDTSLANILSLHFSEAKNPPNCLISEKIQVWFILSIQFNFDF